MQNKFAAIKQRHERDKNRNKFGYPSSTIDDLISMVEDLKKEKSKWKSVAQKRGDVLKTIKSKIEVVLNEQESEDN